MRRGSEGIGGRKKVIDVRVTNDSANVSRTEMEDPEQPRNKEFL